MWQFYLFRKSSSTNALWPPAKDKAVGRVSRKRPTLPVPIQPSGPSARTPPERLNRPGL